MTGYFTNMPSDSRQLYSSLKWRGKAGIRLHFTKGRRCKNKIPSSIGFSIKLYSEPSNTANKFCIWPKIQTRARSKQNNTNKKNDPTLPHK